MGSVLYDDEPKWAHEHKYKPQAIRKFLTDTVAYKLIVIL